MSSITKLSTPRIYYYHELDNDKKRELKYIEAVKPDEANKFRYNPTNARRIITMVFTYNKEGHITYGASIFQRLDASETFEKKKLLQTAMYRFNTNPIEFDIAIEPDVKIKYSIITEAIRRQMFKSGVKNKKSITKELKENVIPSSLLHLNFGPNFNNNFDNTTTDIIDETITNLPEREYQQEISL